MHWTNKLEITQNLKHFTIILNDYLFMIWIYYFYCLFQKFSKIHVNLALKTFLIEM